MRVRDDRKGFPRPTAERGFTLVEVLVALAIAGGALILILGANNASLRRSAAARQEAELEVRAQSKLEELALGLEKGAHGELPGMPGWRWESTRASAPFARLRRVKRLTLRVMAPDGTKAIERAILTCHGEKAE